MTFGFGFMEILVMVVAVVFLYKLATRGRRRCGPCGPVEHGAPETEAELLREIHQGLTRMEKRIEVLETLLLDQEEPRRASMGEKRP